MNLNRIGSHKQLVAVMALVAVITSLVSILISLD